MQRRDRKSKPICLPVSRTSPPPSKPEDTADSAVENFDCKYWHKAEALDADILLKAALSASFCPKSAKTGLNSPSDQVYDPIPNLLKAPWAMKRNLNASCPCHDYKCTAHLVLFHCRPHGCCAACRTPHQTSHLGMMPHQETKEGEFRPVICLPAQLKSIPFTFLGPVRNAL